MVSQLRFDRPRPSDPFSRLRHVHVDGKRHQLATAHALCPFEVVQSTIEAAFEACFVAEQAIESGGIGNAVTERFQLSSHSLNRGARLPVALEATNPVGTPRPAEPCTPVHASALIRVRLSFAIIYRSLFKSRVIFPFHGVQLVVTWCFGSCGRCSVRAF
jgi:hypothetical protein